jgi:hypothetical protein
MYEEITDSKKKNNFLKKQLELKKTALLASGKPLTKRTGSGSVIQCTDLRIRILLKNVTDPRTLEALFFLHLKRDTRHVY